MKKNLINLYCSLAVAGLAQTSYADLNVNGTDNGTWSSTATMTYTSAANDPTTVSSDQTELGFGSAPGSPASLTMSSGTLTLTSGVWDSYVGRQTTSSPVTGKGDGTLNLSGGSLTWNAQGSQNPLFGIGNANAAGIVNISGGTFALNTTTFIVGRDAGGLGQLNITGGLMDCNASTFEFGMGGNPNSTTSGILTFGAGNGVLDFNTDLSSIGFGTGGGANYINFLSGSGGQLEISGWTQSQFSGLVTADDILVNGAVATPNEFAYSNSGGTGIYQLSAVPEPSSLAMVGCGFLTLGLGSFIRRWKKN